MATSQRDDSELGVVQNLSFGSQELDEELKMTGGVLVHCEQSPPNVAAETLNQKEGVGRGGAWNAEAGTR
jgi:spore coat protein U-like protein